MNEIFINIKKNLYELLSAIFFIGLFYTKNTLVHDYFSCRHGLSSDKSDSFFDWSNTKEYLWSESNHHLPVSSLNNCKSILYSLIKNQSRKLFVSYTFCHSHYVSTLREKH